MNKEKWELTPYDENLASFASEENDESLPHSLRRSVWLVQDEEDGETYTADEILDGQPQGIIFDIRHSLYASYKSGEYKYVCKQCQQPLGLKVRTYEGDFFPFFSHFQNSGDCPLKNLVEIDPTRSACEREAVFKVSALYQQMIERLKDVLNRTQGFNSIEENKVISKPEIKGYRKPAIYSRLYNTEVCFDLLVSNPLVSLLVGRNAFYKLHKIFYLWLFPSFTTKQQRLCQKDILYMNRRNVFVFDSKDFYSQANRNFCGHNTNPPSYQYAYEESIRQNKLMLNCYWQTPVASEINGETHISIKWNGPKLVAFDDLKFNWENFELYYHDSDVDFYNSYPIEIQRQIDEWLRIKKDRWVKIFDSIEKRKILYAQLLAKRERRERLKYYHSLIQDGDIDISVRYDEESELYGFSVDDFDIIPPIYYDAKPFFCGYAWVRKKEKWGLIDYHNNRITKFQYSAIKDLGDGLYSCEKGRIEYLLNYKGEILTKKGFYTIDRINPLIIKVRDYSEYYRYNRWGYPEKGIEGTLYGLMDNQGNPITELCYTQIDDFVDGITKALRGNLWGIIDENGTLRLPFAYKEILEVSEDFLIVKKGEYENPAKIDWDGNEIYDIHDSENVNIYESKFLCKFGLIDKSNKIITSLKFDRIKELSNSRFACLNKGQWCLIDTEGHTILEKMDDISNFSDNREYFKFMKNGAWGVVNAMGEIILPNVFNTILEIKDEIITVKKHKNGIIAEVNLKGEEIYLYREFSDVIIYKSRLQNKAGLMDHEYNIVTGLVFDSILEFKEGKAKAKSDSHWGVIDYSGETVIPFEFYELGDFVDGVASAKIIGKGFIDERGNEIYQYHDLGDVTICESRLFKRFGISPVDQTQVPELKYECMPKFNGGLAIVSKEGQWGVININDEIVIPFNYDELTETSTQNYIVRKDGKYGIVNNSGDVLVPLNYDRIIEKKIGLYCVKEKSNGYWGLLNDSNVIVVPLKYDAIGNVGNNIVKVKKGCWWKKITIHNIVKSFIDKNSIDLSKLEKGSIYDAVSTGIIRPGVLIKIPNIGVGLIPAKEILGKNRKLNDFKRGVTLKVQLLRKDLEKNRATFQLVE